MWHRYRSHSETRVLRLHTTCDDALSTLLVGERAGKSRAKSGPGLLAQRERRAEAAKLCAVGTTSPSGRFSLEGHDVVPPWSAFEDVCTRIVF